ncbi:hypothetical protein [Gorillibacterium sp. sgz5001074]|uniref:hypothetical protein n=1 Tax=Gorillibacterium sp. sgz5001074 TaxID=3446695 RepID=UPI003F67FF5A
MATVAASLRLYDQFSSTMLKAQQSMRSVMQTTSQFKQTLQSKLSVKVDLSHLVQQMSRMRQQTQSAAQAVQQYTQRLHAVAAAQQQVARNASKINSASSNSGGTSMLQKMLQAAHQLKLTLNTKFTVNLNISQASKQLAQIQQQTASVGQGKAKGGGLLGAFKSFESPVSGSDLAKKAVSASIGGYAQERQIKDTFIARTGNEAVGSAMFDKFKKDALSAGQDVKSSLEGTLSLLPITQNADQLTKLNGIAQKLAVFDPSGKGPGEAVTSIKEAMGGDTASLAKKYNINAGIMKKSKLEEFGKAGNIPQFIAAFNKVLEQSNMGEKAFQRMMDSPIKKAETLRNHLKSAMADTGERATQALTPVMDTLNQAFQGGKFQFFFDSIQAGMTLLARVTAAAVGFIMDHLGLIQNILVVVGIAVSILAAVWLVNWMIAAFPVIALVGALVLLLSVFNLFGVSTGEILGFVAGVFFALFAGIHNGIAYIWNILLAFAEFFINVFNDPVYAIEKLFYDLLSNIVGYMSSMVNGLLSGVNFLIRQLNKIGVDLPEIEARMDSHWGDSLKPKATRDVVDLSKYRMEHTDLADAFQSGKEMTGKVFNGLPKTSGAFDFGQWNKSADINRVNAIGKIEDKVDISSEDLKMMRELAEINAVQNFVTLTPTVQVQTGDINHGADMDSVISRITQHLEEEFVSSAQGVYG